MLSVCLDAAYQVPRSYKGHALLIPLSIIVHGSSVPPQPPLLNIGIWDTWVMKTEEKKTLNNSDFSAFVVTG